MAEASSNQVMRGRIPLTRRQNIRIRYEQLVCVPEHKRSAIENDFVALYDLFEKTAGKAPEDVKCY